jgi:hypothetical protein
MDAQPDSRLTAKAMRVLNPKEIQKAFSSTKFNQYRPVHPVLRAPVPPIEYKKEYTSPATLGSTPRSRKNARDQVKLNSCMRAVTEAFFFENPPINEACIQERVPGGPPFARPNEEAHFCAPARPERNCAKVPVIGKYPIPFHLPIRWVGVSSAVLLD